MTKHRASQGQCFHRQSSPAGHGALQEVHHLLSVLLRAIVEINSLWERRAIQLNHPPINLPQTCFAGHRRCTTHMQTSDTHRGKQMELEENVAATCWNLPKAFKSCRHMEMSSTLVLFGSPESRCWAATQHTACGPECVHCMAVSATLQGLEQARAPWIWRVTLWLLHTD